MKSIYVAELSDGIELQNEPFLLEEVIRRETKDGRPYLLSTYRDRTGQIGGIFWDVPADVDGWVRPGLLALVTGRVANYRNALQINTTDLNPLADGDLSHFLPTSRRPAAEMIAELRATVAALDEPWRALAGRLLLEPRFLDAFARAPAARSLHHGYIGGLLEHSLSMARLAHFAADHYPYVNRDLLLAGALLHDMGKVSEYEAEGGFAFTEDGRLVGHIARGALWLERAAAELAFPAADLQQLTHLILSHHGLHEYGSPVTPRTLEAILLHQIDLLDSRVQGYFDHLRADPAGGRWSARPSLMFGAELRRPDDFA
ncbi:MAG: 3'-5' exoribonuclease YhaM family protein [Candidatus Promineifilaceae bacterium]